MKPSTLILIHPDHKTLFKNKKHVNQEIEFLLKKKPSEKYKIITYNKKFKKTLKKQTSQNLQKNFLKIVIKSLMFKKQDFRNLKFLFLQLKYWGFLEVRYSKTLKTYIKYPAIIRYIYLFFYTKIKSELIQDWSAQYDSLITICYYDRSILPFVLAFRSQRKKVWDIQHGSISPAHFAYNHNLFKIKSNLAPTGFYIYQKNAKNYLKKSPCDVILLQSKKYPKVKQAKNVLVSLQWASKVPKNVTDFLKDIKTKKVVLRMHPRDHDPFFKKFEDPYFFKFCKRSKNFELQTGSEPIENTLKSTHLHFTENCSIVHQAAERRIVSFFWCRKFAPKMFQNEIKLGLAKQVKTNGDLTKIIADYNL